MRKTKNKKMRRRRLLCEKPLPRAPFRRGWGGGGAGGEAASLREAPLPPDPSLPKSGWRLAGVDSSSLVPPEGWARFLANRLWSRRLTEPPRPSNYRPRRGRRFPKGERKAARRAPSFGRAAGTKSRLRRGEIPLGSFRRRSCHALQRMTEDTPLLHPFDCFPFVLFIA